MLSNNIILIAFKYIRCIPFPFISVHVVLTTLLIIEVANLILIIISRAKSYKVI